MRKIFLVRSLFFSTTFFIMKSFVPGPLALGILAFLCAGCSAWAASENNKNTGSPEAKIVFRDVHEDETKEIISEKLNTCWQSLTPETKAAIKQIEFVSDAYAEKSLGWDKGKDGEALPGGFLIFRAGERFHFRVFRHEAAHERYYQLNRDLQARAMKSEDAQKLKEAMRDKNISEEEGNRLRKTYLGKIKNSPFNREWRSVAGDVYGRVSFEREDGFWMWSEFMGKTGEEIEIVISEKGKRYVYGPRHGCVRPYGCSSLLEDVASFADKMDEPSFFKNLMNPGSAEYDLRYEKKLRLYHKNNFISDEEYFRVLEAGGLQ